jgi:hypothetical protein
MAEENDIGEESATSDKPAPSSTEASPTVATDQKPDDVVSTEVIKGKNGSVLTRTTTRDGKIHIKRVNKKGDVTVEFDDFYGMSAAVLEAARKQRRRVLTRSFRWCGFRMVSRRSFLRIETQPSKC